MVNKILLAVMIVLIAAPAMAQNPDNKDNKDYVIGAGDILNIKIWDHDDLERTVEVSQEGDFTYPFIGRIKAANHSVFDLERYMKAKLADGYLVNPQVSVTVAEYRNQKIFVFGEVNKPGSYVLRHPIHFLEAVSEAGGFTENRGSLGIIVRPRNAAQASGPLSPDNAEKSQVVRLNLDALINGSTNANDIMVKPGDSIYVRQADNIYVVGEVVAPGKQKWEKGMTVREAIGLAGGGKDTAAINRTKIIRNVDGKEKEFSPHQNDPVLPNDVIKVPQSWF